MIHNLPSPKSTKKSKIVGRGVGSGKGWHTTGKGTKGQKSRTGYKKPRPGFEGGQNPLSKRLPKLRGLSNAARTRKFKANKEVNTPIKLSVLADTFKPGDSINMQSLVDSKLVVPLAHKMRKVKIVFDKSIDKKLLIEGLQISKSAVAAVEKAGGSVTV